MLDLILGERLRWRCRVRQRETGGLRSACGVRLTHKDLFQTVRLGADM